MSKNIGEGRSQSPKHKGAEGRAKLEVGLMISRELKHVWNFPAENPKAKWCYTLSSP